MPTPLIRGALTLADIASRISYLDLACNRCDRRGRLSVARLVELHGASMPLPALLRVLAADCQRMIDGKMHDPCGVHMPELPAVLVRVDR